MFIFQNNRGKKPSNLEIIKAQFMYNVHLYGGDNTKSLLENIKGRFESIYKHISYIEGYINEDDVLSYTLRVYFNNLHEGNSLEKVNTKLSEENPIAFIEEFARLLSLSFEYLHQFYKKDERVYEVHSLVTLGGLAIAMPFILKAYQFNVGPENLRELCKRFESIVLRHRLIGTRADMISRLNDVFEQFTKDNPSIKPIIDRIDWMKGVKRESWWWAYWNNDQLKYAIQGGVYHPTAKYILWKYENHLISQGKAGYSPIRYEAIVNPELEHISPQAPTHGEPVEAGYSDYDEEFKQRYLDCLGNYLLVSKSHNCSIGNKPFAEKRQTYDFLAQQREVQGMTEADLKWDKEKIAKRQEKLIEFVLSSF
jgi:hypothetical protein